MTSFTWFGHWQTWAILVGVWISLGALFALALRVIAHAQAWKERRNRP